MIIINRRKNTEKYKFEQMPNFSHRRSVTKWNHIQKMNAELMNIDSIDIQVKDIRQMIYPHHPNLVSLYARLDLMGEYSDDDYINIPKCKQDNKYLIFEILNTNWLLKLDDLENKTEEELEYEKFCLQNEISNMKKSIKSSNAYYANDNIKLLEYKLLCLEDYMLHRISKQQYSQMLVKEKD